MAVTTWTAGQVLAAQDLNDTFASKLDLAGGKILQIVRATDSTNRSTTSTSFVDANISVTITPQKTDSAILLVWSYAANLSVGTSNADGRMAAQITDNSNNAVSGAENVRYGNDNYTISGTAQLRLMQTLIGYSTPATTSATTYKGRFKRESTGVHNIVNNESTGQLFAIEVSA